MCRFLSVQLNQILSVSACTTEVPAECIGCIWLCLRILILLAAWWHWLLEATHGGKATTLPSLDSVDLTEAASAQLHGGRRGFILARN